MNYLKPSRHADECLSNLNRFNDALIQTNTSICEDIQPVVEKTSNKTNASSSDIYLIDDSFQKLREFKNMGLFIQKEMDLIEVIIKTSEKAKLDLKANQLKMAAFASLWVNAKSNLQNLFDIVIELMSQCRDFYERNRIEIDYYNERQFKETRFKTNAI